MQIVWVEDERRMQTRESRCCFGGWTDRWMDRCMDGWMEEVGVARVGEEKGEKRVIEGGNMGQNLAINTKKNQREEG